MSGERLTKTSNELLRKALREAMEWNWLDAEGPPQAVVDQCELALAESTSDEPPASTLTTIGGMCAAHGAFDGFRCPKCTALNWPAVPWEPGYVDRALDWHDVGCIKRYGAVYDLGEATSMCACEKRRAENRSLSP